MQRVAEDLRFALTHENVFLSAHTMGKISRELGSIGYKNTDLIPLWFEKITDMVKQRGQGTKYLAGPSFDQVVYGDQKNFLPRHYVF